MDQAVWAQSALLSVCQLRERKRERPGCSGSDAAHSAEMHSGKLWTQNFLDALTEFRLLGTAEKVLSEFSCGSSATVRLLTFGKDEELCPTKSSWLKHRPEPWSGL